MLKTYLNFRYIWEFYGDLSFPKSLFKFKNKEREKLCMLLFEISRNCQPKFTRNYRVAVLKTISLSYYLGSNEYYLLLVLDKIALKRLEIMHLQKIRSKKRRFEIEIIQQFNNFKKLQKQNKQKTPKIFARLTSGQLNDSYKNLMQNG